MRGYRSTLVFAVCVAVGCSPETSRQSANEKWDFADAFPAYTPTMCVPANTRERSLLNLATSAIEQATADDSSWLDIGAQKYLAHYQFRPDGTRWVAVCTPDDILRRVAAAFDTRKDFGKGRLVEYQLELASRLPTRSPFLVEAIGKSAFNPTVQQSETFDRRDIRPFARTVLAGFGGESKAFQNIAFDQISIKDAMGTGAAQVAAATAHPDALPRIEQLMEDALSAVPAEQAVPRATRDRLYELAWAIVFAGEAGKRHTKPIHNMMHRKVQSWAPPFGMVELQPKRLCGVLARIEGAESLAPYAFCLDEQVPFEQ